MPYTLFILIIENIICDDDAILHLLIIRIIQNNISALSRKIYFSNKDM